MCNVFYRKIHFLFFIYFPVLYLKIERLKGKKRKDCLERQLMCFLCLTAGTFFEIHRIPLRNNSTNANKKKKKVCGGAGSIQAPLSSDF